jgi:hypothetical protein
MKSKKAQIVGQIFVFILATVVFVLIVMYGYKAISSLMIKGEQASFIKFQNELTNSVSSIALDYGSVKCEDFAVPKKYTEFCFVDTREVFYSPPPAENDKLMKLSALYPFIAGSIKSGSSQNAFLIPPSALAITLPNAHVADSVADGFFCVNATRNTISLRLEGGGTDGALLSQKC